MTLNLMTNIAMVKTASTSVRFTKPLRCFGRGLRGKVVSSNRDDSRSIWGRHRNQNIR